MDETTIAELAQKLAVSRRILARGADASDNPVIGGLICEQLERDMPRLERKLAWLRTHQADRRLKVRAHHLRVAA